MQLRRATNHLLKKGLRLGDEYLLHQPAKEVDVLLTFWIVRSGLSIFKKWSCAWKIETGKYFDGSHEGTFKK